MINQNTLKIFDDLYDKTYKNVLKYVVCNCSNVEDIKDIIQNIYIEILNKVQKGNVYRWDKETGLVNKLDNNYKTYKIILFRVWFYLKIINIFK